MQHDADDSRGVILKVSKQVPTHHTGADPTVAIIAMVAVVERCRCLPTMLRLRWSLLPHDASVRITPRSQLTGANCYHNDLGVARTGSAATDAALLLTRQRQYSNCSSLADKYHHHSHDKNKPYIKSLTSNGEPIRLLSRQTTLY